MASKNAPVRKKFRVAVSGTTIDGREISGQMLRQAAENYDPEVWGSRVNVEHMLSRMPSSEFSAVGDVISLSTGRSHRTVCRNRANPPYDGDVARRQENLLKHRA